MKRFHSHRTKIEYIAEILIVALEGEQKTRVMYRVYTSYKQLKQILEELQRAELLMYNPYSKTYHTTNKGRHFLELYRELSKSGIFDK
ncbi:MAG: winged helix-turn-helix domain-containing protein [Nitrososphaeraceae archaeon]